jgi:hypothetical protein
MEKIEKIQVEKKLDSDLVSTFKIIFIIFRNILFGSVCNVVPF